MIEQYLECGKIINTHGVRGTVKVEAYCDSPKVLASLPRIFMKDKDGYKEYKVTHGSVQKQFVLLTFETVTTLEEAVLFKNNYIYADRGDFNLPDGKCFISDLLGLPVIDADDGKVYGTLADVTNSGAQDIYVVKTENGEVMVPAVPEFLVKTDPETGIFLRPIDGMFD